MSGPAWGRESAFDRIDALAREAIDSGQTPGVVFLVSHQGRVLYRKAHGLRCVRPAAEPMTLDTMFDLASLTKVVATASCMAALLEEGRFRTGDTVATYWPEFRQAGKEVVTIRQLLTHTSGLPAWVNYQRRFHQEGGPPRQDHREEVLAAIAATPPANPPGTRFVYSDLGYMTLGELVRRISGEPLDRYAARRIFRPLGMRDTGFNPGEGARRAAPTTERFGRWLRGSVHDENADTCGGVAGHAGLFSTADDLARFARMALGAWGRRGGLPLGRLTLRMMARPQSPPGLPVRGWGWDIDSSYSHVRGDLLPVGSFGHTGFTGTYIWIDPTSETLIVGLSNRVHPDGRGNVLRLWAKVANVVAGIVDPGRSLDPPA